MLISNISAIFKVPMEPIFSAPVFHRLLYSTHLNNDIGTYPFLLMLYFNHNLIPNLFYKSFYPCPQYPKHYRNT